MAEQITQDVVKEAQSVGNALPIDDIATTTRSSAGDGETPADSTTARSYSSKFSATTSQSAPNTTITQVDGKSLLDNVSGDDVATSNVDSSVHLQSDSGSKKGNEELVNGDSSEHSAVEDAPHVPVDASVGSDTDISRPGSVDTAKERAIGHLRSNSVKKPASFKSVSVTKNFLAKSAVTTPPTRPGEKGSPAAQANPLTAQIAKPRLVAKSGSGIGNIPRSSLKTNGVGSGPDASKVWNKNQPVPPPPPKQFTDEELKLQYGIHLATRLPADESGKEAKWADIDDDEDDWAPDTVQWMDGTKSTVVATENQPPPPEEPKPIAKKEISIEPLKPAQTPSANVSRPNSTTGSKTILKPGTLTSSGKAGLVLKGQPDKPTLVAKPPAPATVKSPWAPLPPVEKVSPVQINPPVQQHAPIRSSQRDSHGYDSMPPPPPPATTKEFAPDDFNRSWRDERGNKELFNSHSGRYEPVNEVRRGSFRENFRQPSVLQRPSQDGPAEPSAAFQTSRTSADGPVWGRRRNSSNVSGGSGRRMSFDRRPAEPPMPINIQRRESHSIHGSEVMSPSLTPGFPSKAHLGDHGSVASEQHATWTQKSSPNVIHAQPMSPYGSVASSGHQDAAVPGAMPGPAVPTESAVEVQNRLMREKLERARLQKQKEREEEERQEAEKKERLRKKLEALGMGAEEPKSVSKERSPARVAERSPRKEKAVPAAVQSPPKPPVPTSEGEVAQYGLMKVHQPHPFKKPAAHHDLGSAASNKLPPRPSPSPIKASAEVQPKAASLVQESSGYSPPSHPHPQPSHPPSQQPATLNLHTPLKRDNNSGRPDSSLNQVSQPEVRAPTQVLKASQPALPSWSPTLPQQTRAPWALSSTPSSNVWGPPQAKERALGNGTFDSSYNRGQPRPASHQLPPQPSANQPSAIELHQPFNLPPSQAQVSQPQHFSHPDRHILPESAPPKQDKITQSSNHARAPGPIGPPNMPAPASRADLLKGTSWGNFAATIARDDRASAKKNEEEFERMGGAAFRPHIKETIRGGDKAVQESRELAAVLPPGMTVDGPNRTPDTAEAKAKDDAVKPVGASVPVPVNATSANEPHSTQVVNAGTVHVQPTGQGPRSSRFFPRASEASAQPTGSSGKTDSPPPPETESHPAFGGDKKNPRVNIPKPPPRVRLPPPKAEQATAPSQATGGVSMPRTRGPAGAGPGPIALNPEWQARFNGLLGRTTPTTAAVTTSAQGVAPTHSAAYSKQKSLAVAPASKAPLEVRQGATPATVSLPAGAVNATKPFVDDKSDAVSSRTSAEQELLEEREFGSLPVVSLPKVPHLRANEPPCAIHPTLRPHLRTDRHMEPAQTKIPLDMDEADQNGNVQVVIRMPGMCEPITRTLPKFTRGPRTAGDKKRGERGSFTGNTGAPNNSQNSRGRKQSNYQRQGASSQRSPRPSTGGNGWGNNNPSSNNNNNNRSTPQHSPWNRRAAPVH